MHRCCLEFVVMMVVHRQGRTIDVDPSGGRVDAGNHKHCLVVDTVVVVVIIETMLWLVHAGRQCRHELTGATSVSVVVHLHDVVVVVATVDDDDDRFLFEKL